MRKRKQKRYRKAKEVSIAETDGKEKTSRETVERSIRRSYKAVKEFARLKWKGILITVGALGGLSGAEKRDADPDEGARTPSLEEEFPNIEEMDMARPSSERSGPKDVRI